MLMKLKREFLLEIVDHLDPNPYHDINLMMVIPASMRDFLCSVQQVLTSDEDLDMRVGWIDGYLVPFGSYLENDSKDRDLAFIASEYWSGSLGYEYKVELPVAAIIRGLLKAAIIYPDGSVEIIEKNRDGKCCEIISEYYVMNLRFRKLLSYMKGIRMDNDIDIVVPMILQKTSSGYYYEAIKLGGIWFMKDLGFGNIDIVESYHSPTELVFYNLLKDYNIETDNFLNGMFHDENSRTLFYQVKRVMEINLLRYIQEIEDGVSATSLLKFIFAWAQYDAWLRFNTSRNEDFSTLLNRKSEVYDYLKKYYPRIAEPFRKAWKDGDYSALNALFGKDLPDEFNSKYRVDRYTYSTYIKEIN